jgi:CheY-like chemotaxis protein
MPEMDSYEVAEQIHADPELMDSRIVLLSSADQLDNAERLRELRIAAHLLKPIRQSSLMNTIMNVLSVSPKPKTETEFAHDSSLGEAEESLNILLAEANAINQKLAIRILEKRGHSVTMVADGKEALEALSENEFDAILMDVQMPEMDGLEATRAIRETERDSGKHIPIIAMTAHVMKGDRERCLEAGMDGYVSKPIKIKELFAAIEELVDKGNRSEVVGTGV